jgi:1,2-diacylglycerol-3-alpha-glucose alpha-1,2-glucosyltransferase
MRTVHIYSGSLALVSKSGVGQAAKHQRAALESVGVHIVTDWDCRAEVVHINTVLPVSLWAARHARRRGQKVIWYGHSTEKDFRNSFTGSNLLASFQKSTRFCRYCPSL